jgi:hypothetical protein
MFSGIEVRDVFKHGTGVQLTNGESGKLAGSTSWGIDVHVSTHL